MSDPRASSAMVIKRLGFPWETTDPFLFCVHHRDEYPVGNEALGPAASLAGRDLGQDFAGLDGWRMYHGQAVPGFPPHPHRGFETVTIVRRGFVDHSDSLGAAARFGEGDTQWLTAGQGIVHAEMFPLLERERANPLELFQIWLNLPAADKAADPHFALFWKEEIPVITFPGGMVTVIAGDPPGGSGPLSTSTSRSVSPPPPPPRSWASRKGSHVAIWLIRLAPGGRFTLPVVPGLVARTLYVVEGAGLTVEGTSVAEGHSARLLDFTAALLVNDGNDSEEACEVLLLQGRPIAEPVVQHGPFVMNEVAEIQRAFADYRRTGFGGWPWPVEEPVHARDAGRFARFPDGRVSKPKG